MSSLALWIWTFIVTTVAPLLLEGLKLLGIGFVVYQGVDILFNQLETGILSNLTSFGSSSFGGAAFQIMQIAGITVAVKIILATAGAILTLKGVNAVGNKKSMVFKA